MSKFLVSGYVGFDNFGDEAIVFVLSEYLKNIGAEKITWISSNPQKTSKIYGVNSVGMFDFWNSLKECDFLISGGGSLLQDITSLKSLVYYISIIAFALVLNKKVVILAQGITGFRTRIGEFLTKFVLKRCYSVSVRDENSQILLKKWGIKSQLVFDPVFEVSIPERTKQGVGIQLREFSNLDKTFITELAEQVSKCFNNYEIKLVSMQNSFDIPVLKIFAEILDKNNIKYEIIKMNSVGETISTLSGLEYLIAMRFHACLIGAKAGVRVLGINYDEKVKNLSRQMSFPLLNIKKDEISSGLEELLNLQTEQNKVCEMKNSYGSFKEQIDLCNNQNAK